LNVIQIVSDTFRRDFLGCYGNEWVHTENLDALAGESAVFDRAYIASFPTIPNRHDIFTGRYTFTYSAWSPLPTDEVILSQCLRQAGYTTMLIVDTYHMIRDAHYFDRGFDGWLWTRGQEHDRYITRPHHAPKELTEAMDEQYLRNVSMRRFESDYFVAQTMTEAARWLELNYDQHEKFFLHIDTFDPHEPWDPPRWYAEMYDPGWKGGPVKGGAYRVPFERLAKNLTKDELRHLRALYAGEVTLVDRWVGMLLRKVKDLGLLEDTAIIFTTDHGSYHGEHGYLGKRTHLYEEVAHIPLILRLPDSEGKTRGRYQALVQPPDLMPTILELAGAKIPDTVQGRSLLPVIRGEAQPREFVVSSPSLVRRGALRHQPAAPRVQITVTSDKWSLIATRADAPPTGERGERLTPELYHLPTDPKQTKNLYDEKTEVAEELRSNMIKFLESLGTEEEILRPWRSKE